MNGVLFDKAQAKLLQFPGGLGGGYTNPSTARGDFFGLRDEMAGVKL